MKRFCALFYLVCFGVLCQGTGAVRAQSIGSLAGWGRHVVVDPSAFDNLASIAAGTQHSLGLKSDGTIIAWGLNDYGQCEVSAPNAYFVGVAAGYNHNLGLSSEGDMSCT
jgi:hypothetical protein